jgi:hypothetical protein
LRLAERLSLPSSTSQDVASLDDLEAFLNAIAEAEVDWSKQEATRRSALNILEEVLEFSCREQQDKPHLADCQAQARALHATISTCPPSELPSEADRLAAGDHPLANVVALVLDREEVSGEDWARHYEDAATAFGKRLAVAVARDRVLPRATPRASIGEGRQARVAVEVLAGV